MNLRIVSTFLIASFTTIPIGVFSSCAAKKQVDETIKDLDGYNWDGREYGFFHKNDYIIDYKNKSVTYINGIKYYGTNVTIPDYVWVKDEKFKVLLGPGCFKNNHFLMGTLTFNIHTTFIPEECFYKCDGLENIAFKNYITSFEKYAFYSCLLLEKIISDPIYMSTVQYFKDYCFFSTSLNKSFVFGSELKEIGAHAFSGCGGLVVVDLSHNVCTKISDYAFCNCQTLVELILPPTFVEFGDHSFLGCTDLETIFLPNANMELSIGDYAFFNCTSFTGFSRKCTFSHLGDYCFSGCSKYSLDHDCLKNPKLTEIGNQAFAQCSNSIIKIPKNIKIIYRFAFWCNSGALGKLSILDFTDYTKDDPIPLLCGNNVFYDAEKTGTIYLNSDVNIPNWKDALTNKGLEIGPSNWNICTK